LNLAQKLIQSHLLEGGLRAGEEIALRSTRGCCRTRSHGVMLALEALGLERVKTEIAVQYVDHNCCRRTTRTPTTTCS